MSRFYENYYGHDISDLEIVTPLFYNGVGGLPVSRGSLKPLGRQKVKKSVSRIQTRYYISCG